MIMVLATAVAETNNTIHFNAKTAALLYEIGTLLNLESMQWLGLLSLLARHPQGQPSRVL